MRQRLSTLAIILVASLPSSAAAAPGEKVGLVWVDKGERLMEPLSEGESVRSYSIAP